MSRTNYRKLLVTILGMGALVLRAGAADLVDLLPGGDWTRYWTTTGNWQTQPDGVVHLEPRPGEKGWKRYDAYLWSKEQYTDFEIEFDYQVGPKSNSGFYFHVGNPADPVATGIEVQIFDSHPKGDTGKLNDHDSGGIIPGIPPAKNAAKPAGEWNHFQITCRGDRLTVVLNGETVNTVDLTSGKLKDRPKSGHIGFQDHALPVSLRQVRIRSLSQGRP